MSERAICLFSGGKDSTIALVWCMKNFAETTALSFNYPSRPKGEVRAAREIAARLKIDLVEIDTPFLRNARELTDSRNSEAPGTGAAYVPHRNLVFHSVALCLSEQMAVKSIVSGHLQSDAEAYEDASSSYLGKLYELADSGQYAFRAEVPQGRRAVMPFARMSDKDVIRLGYELDAPLSLSWSCLVDGFEHCGQCVSCLDRRAALES